MVEREPAVRLGGNDARIRPPLERLIRSSFYRESRVNLRHSSALNPDPEPHSFANRSHTRNRHFDDAQVSLNGSQGERTPLDARITPREGNIYEQIFIRNLSQSRILLII